VPVHHRLNIKLDLRSLFGLHVYSCTHWLRPRNPSPTPHLGSYTRALLVSQDRRHLFVTPCRPPSLKYPSATPDQRPNSWTKSKQRSYEFSSLLFKVTLQHCLGIFISSNSHNLLQFLQFVTVHGKGERRKT
jgi:hypothetical protein